MDIGYVCYSKVYILKPSQHHLVSLGVPYHLMPQIRCSSVTKSGSIVWEETLWEEFQNRMTEEIHHARDWDKGHLLQDLGDKNSVCLFCVAPESTLETTWLGDKAVDFNTIPKKKPKTKNIFPGRRIKECKV